LLSRRSDIDRVIHLAAQAGVRHSLINPYIYMHSNLNGHLILLEACRQYSDKTDTQSGKF